LGLVQYARKDRPMIALACAVLFWAFRIADAVSGKARD